MHTLTPESGSSNCVIPPATVPTEKWIALVNKGGCKLAFILSASVLRNASAVVIYNQDDMHKLHSRRLKCKQLQLFSSSDAAVFMHSYIVASRIISAKHETKVF